MEESAPVVKKTTRIRKTATSSILPSTETSTIVPSSLKPSNIITQVFDDLTAKLIQNKLEYDNLQKEIAVKVIESGSQAKNQTPVDKTS